jgi:hypothetical protein
MSVYMPQNTPEKGKKKEKRELKQPGSYTSEDLTESKKIPTKGGYR